MFMSIVLWAQVVVLTHVMSYDVDWDRSGYSTFTSIPRVDELSTDTPGLGRHSLVSEPRYTAT